MHCSERQPRGRIRRTLVALLAASLVVGCRGGEGAKSRRLSATDLSGVERSILESEGEAAIVLLFVAVDCPISNVFAPELGRIRADYSGRGVTFLRIYTDPDFTSEQIRLHGEDYDFVMPALLDFDHSLVEYAKVDVVPTAVILAPDGELLYRGRIDDRFVDFGKQRPQPTRRDLRLALDQILEGRRPEVSDTDAVGCFISELLSHR